MGEQVNLTNVQDYHEKIVTWRRDLHQIPELGLSLPKTIKYVCKALDNIGLSYDASYVDGNGISVIIEGEKDIENSDLVMGLRADMDGLPIVEETGLPFKSTNGNMHACGHDGHTSVLLGVADYLHNHRELFGGTVKLIFQPGEEYPGGAKPMIDEGVMKNPDVTRMMGFHIGHLDREIEPGKISYRTGPMMASMDRFQLTIIGKGFHAAYPENSHDPIIVANQIISAFQTIKTRNIKATEACVISVTHIEGGMNQNIIPDEVFIEGTVRTLNNNVRETIYQRMQEICEGMSLAFEVDIDFSYDFKYPPLINDEKVTENCVQILKASLGEQGVIEAKEPLMGGEDFAFFCEEVPSTFFFLANPGFIEGSFHGHHHSKFDIDENQLILAFKAFVACTLDYLSE